MRCTSHPANGDSFVLEADSLPEGPAEDGCCGSCTPPPAPHLDPFLPSVEVPVFTMVEVPSFTTVELCQDGEDICLTTTEGGMEEMSGQDSNVEEMQRKDNRLPFQIFPDPVEVVLGPETSLHRPDHDHAKERLPSIVVEPTEVSEVESGELRWPPENMDLEEDEEDLFLEHNYTLPDINDNFIPEIQPIQIMTLVCYGLVFLVGVPGNSLVVWVTGFRMPFSVTSLWFLNLALADLLCCLSLPLLMVPLAHDDHWHFGPLACTLIKGMFYLVMYCSILLLVLISLDRWMLVSRPVWCQNHRRPKKAVWVCVGVWCLALLGSIPQFIYTKQIEAGEKKRECTGLYTPRTAWLVTSFRFLGGFVLPFLAIVVSHWVVYKRAGSGTVGGARSKRTLRVIVAVAMSFFLCWLPLHIMDFLVLVTPRNSPHRPKVYLAHAITLCLAYFNSCLNPLLYVCLGRGFKESMNRSLRSLFHFISEEPVARTSITNTKSTATGHEMTGMV
ncbi:C5a anaphylatoxin chemotactic receptor 1 [Polymixia lowei]